MATMTGYVKSLCLVGETYLVTTDAWFYAPDGQMYQAVFGTVKGIFDDSKTLGIKTNARSTNWYLAVGNMLIAGCQIHYAVKTNKCSKSKFTRSIDHAGKGKTVTENLSRIYFADDGERVV